MLPAIRSDTNTNVVATPSAVTIDNQSAELKEAQEVPFVTGQFTNTTAVTGGSANPFQTIQRQEAGTILKVTPTTPPEGPPGMPKIPIESPGTGQKPPAPAHPVTNNPPLPTQVLIQ